MIIMSSEIARNLLHVRNTDGFGDYVILKRSTVSIIYISHSRVLLALGVWYLLDMPFYYCEGILLLWEVQEDWWTRRYFWAQTHRIPCV